MDAKIELKQRNSEFLFHILNLPGNFTNASEDGTKLKFKLYVNVSDKQAMKFSEFLSFIALIKFVNTIDAVVGGKNPERPVSGGSGVLVEKKSQPIKVMDSRINILQVIFILNFNPTL
jgi:hypothetical protein